MRRIAALSVSLWLGLSLSFAAAQDGKPPAPRPETPARPKPDAPAAKPDAPAAKPDAPAAKPDAPPSSAPEVSADAPAELGKPPAGSVALAPNSVPRANLFPLEGGRTWRYSLRLWLSPTKPQKGGFGESQRLHRLDVLTIDPMKIDGKDARGLEYRLDDEPGQRAWFFEEAGAVLCPRRILGAGDHARDFPLSPPEPTLKGDLVSGSSWDWQGKVGGGPGKLKAEVVREEKLQTKAGAFPAVLIKVTATVDDETSGVQWRWFSPQVGLVREEAEVRSESHVTKTVAELVKFETKKN